MRRENYYYIIEKTLIVDNILQVQIFSENFFERCSSIFIEIQPPLIRVMKIAY